MTITEALKSSVNYIVVQTADQRRWMYWDNVSSCWIVKEGRRGGSRVLVITEDEERAIEELLRKRHE